MGGFFGGGGGGGSGPSTAPVVLEAPSASFPNGFVLTQGANITLTAAGTTLTVAASAPASTANITPDTHPASPTVWDDEFETGSSIDTSGSRSPGAIPWVPKNIQTATTSIANGSVLLVSGTGGLNNDTAWLQTLAGAGATWAFGCKRLINDQSAFAGLFLGFAASGKGYYFGQDTNTTFAQTQNDYTGTGSSSAATTSTFTSSLLAQYMKLAFDGTHLLFGISLDGINYFTMLSATLGAFLGSAPDSIGLMVGASSVSAVLTCSTSFDWWRKLA